MAQSRFLLAIALLAAVPLLAAAGRSLQDGGDPCGGRCTQLYNQCNYDLYYCESCGLSMGQPCCKSGAVGPGCYCGGNNKVVCPGGKKKPPPAPQPTPKPTMAPTLKPTKAPTAMPTMAPTLKPTKAPTAMPTMAPTPMPTKAPTAMPTMAPTAMPTMAPTAMPTMAPTAMPTMAPTARPTKAPTAMPTKAPTPKPTVKPPKKGGCYGQCHQTYDQCNPAGGYCEACGLQTGQPCCRSGALFPGCSCVNHVVMCSPAPTAPSMTPAPTKAPPAAPTEMPTAAPTMAPVPQPTKAPTPAPTMAQTPAPTRKPTKPPGPAPTMPPTDPCGNKCTQLYDQCNTNTGLCEACGLLPGQPCCASGAVARGCLCKKGAVYCPVKKSYG